VNAGTCEPVNAKFIQLPIVQVSDTTGDAQRTAVCPPKNNLALQQN